MSFSDRNVASRPQEEVRPAGNWSLVGMARAGILLALVVTILSVCLTSSPSTAQNGDEPPTRDYAELFRDVAYILENSYLVDPDSVETLDLMKKAFAALENAADEVYVESAPETEPYVNLHAENRVQVFDLDAVESMAASVRMLEQAFDFLKSHYRGDKELNEVRYSTVNGFLSGLDPHTMVFSPKAFKDFAVHIEGEIYGVGMYVGSRDGKLMVLEVLKGTPAFRAGFKKGDQIAKIGDESTINMTVTEAVEKIRGPRYSEVVLTVKRPKPSDPDQLELLDIAVKRDRVVIKSVESKLITDWNGDSDGPWKGGVGYVQVINFDKNTTPTLKSHLERLEEENGGKPLAGLILDLRDNSGGLLTQAVEMSDLFLESGTIVITASRNHPLYSQEAADSGEEPEYPIIVLANETSASGAEIVTGALQKNNRAIVIGTRTFGKGSVQQLHQLRYGAQLKITVSEYLLPGKISIQETGVMPDIHARPVLLEEDGDFDLFPNERSMTEKDYDRHIVSQYAKRETPDFVLDYYDKPVDFDSQNAAFMSGDLQPEEDKLVQMALEVLEEADKPYNPQSLLEERTDAIKALKARLFDEIVKELAEQGIDWSTNGDPAADIDPETLELEVTSKVIEEPSGDPEDPVPVPHVRVEARLTNNGDRTIYRMKGLSRSDYYLYKDQEFLFGKLDPGETIARSVKIRLPSYFPHARNDLLTIEVSSMPRTPGWEQPDTILFAKSVPVEIEDHGRPSFAYTATVLDVGEESRPVGFLSPGMDARIRLEIRNTGDAPVHKGIAILRNETGRQIFLRKGRREFPEQPETEQTSEDETAEEAPRVELKPGETTQVEFVFEVRAGDPVEAYDFELAIVDPYSNANLVRELSIPRKGNDDVAAFPNGVEFVPPRVTAFLVDSDENAAIVTTQKHVRIKAHIEAETSSFKTWIYNSLVGDRDYPDKIYFTDSKGESSLEISRRVHLRPGTNFFTVVARDSRGLEARTSVFVRRAEPELTARTR